MAELYQQTSEPVKQYYDRFSGLTPEAHAELCANSTTVYVGNMSFFTTEEQIFEVFSKAGEVRRVILGLDKNDKTPCGFCFVEYYTRSDLMNCVKYLNGIRLDDRQIRTDVDPGFKEGRQYGRGKSGGQIRDEYRTEYDSGRGGYGRRIQQQFRRSNSPVRVKRERSLDLRSESSLKRSARESPGDPARPPAPVHRRIRGDDDD